MELINLQSVCISTLQPKICSTCIVEFNVLFNSRNIIDETHLQYNSNMNYGELCCAVV